MEQLKPDPFVKAIVLYTEEGAFGFREYKLPRTVVDKHGELVEKSLPDIFPIFLGTLTRKAKEIFGF